MRCGDNGGASGTMRLLLVCYTFPPEDQPSGVMTHQLAEDLAASGHAVTVLTGFPNHPAGVLYPGWRRRWRQVARKEPYRLVRTWHITNRTPRLVGRSLFYLSFALTSLMNALFLGPFDIVYCDSTPVFGAVSCWVMARIKRAGLVYAVLDVYPEAIVDAGLLKPRGMATRILKWIDRGICLASDQVLVISEGIRQRILDRGVPEHRVTVVPMWMDNTDVAPAPRLNSWRREQGIPDDAFVVLYAGTVGPVQRASVLVDVAALLVDLPDVLVLFVAHGVSRPELEETAAQKGLNNVRFLDYQPRERLAEVQASSDVSVITLQAGQGLNSFPSKVLAYMAAARPVIASVDSGSDTAGFVREGGFGVVVAPEDPKALAAAVRELRLDPDGRANMAMRGRELFLAHYSRKAGTQVYERLLVAAVKSAG